MTRALAVVVLAAGQGTRMKSATPKVLHAISGRTLLGHVLHAALELEPAQLLVVVRHERDAVAAHVLEHAPHARIVDQDEIPGTGRAVELAVAALPADFDGDVMVLSGDVPLVDAELLREVLHAHTDEVEPSEHAFEKSMTITTMFVDDPTGYGRIVEKRRKRTDPVLRIVEERDATEKQRQIDHVNVGTYVFRVGPLRDALARIGTANAQGEKYLTDVVGLLTADDGPYGVATWAYEEPRWLGVNDRAQLAEAERILNARIVHRHQLAGVTVRDPATTWIDVDVTIGEDSEILPGTQLRGATTIGANAVVGPDTTLTDTEVGDFATVERTVANLAVIGTSATVGPFAYLRPGTQLGAGGKIGTYVETKNAVIGRGSKVPHLSYVGDAEIGEDTNLGASTITANYDGVSKHRTVIGSHVHTGVHSSLVAPVEVGDGATLGAGAVVRKDVPADSLAISVAPQRNVGDWKPATEPTEPGTPAGGGGHAH